jgi:hypothetical protein
MLYADRVKLFAEASLLFTHAVFQLVVVRKTASSVCILQGAKKMEVGGCSIRTADRMMLDPSFCLVELLEFVVSTTQMSAHIALN